jgi:uncharacterized protein YndB with AHSA1/START domain
MTIIGDRVEHEIRIDAPPETVYAYFVDPDKHPAWMGRHAELDPRPGGIYRVMHEHATVAGTYLVVEPPRHVAFTWGFEGDDAIPPDTSRVDITLTPDGDATLVRLVHTGLPHPALSPHDEGWHRHLVQLAGTANQAV